MKNENPQFGYAVDLIGPIDGRIQFVAVSAPGNPSFKFSDPGFVEIQNLQNLPRKLVIKSS